MGKNKGDRSGETRMPRRIYEAQLEVLQLELNRLVRWVQHRGQRVVVLFEGRDTAGKGGVINTIAQTLNPRQCQIVALPRPTEAETTQWYFQRHVAHLPAAGHLALFDRSWYNRAGVEHVMGYCTPRQYERFLEQAPQFERMLVDDGILLFKYWLTVDQQEQERRIAERRDDPLKRWKLSPIDLKARERYHDYGRARDTMLACTHTDWAPWTLVDFNDQRLGRLTLIRHLLDRMPDCEVPAPPLELPPLGHPPEVERFDGPVAPIPPLAWSGD
ncbi:transcriptional regulator [Sphaerotilus hippei]|uniref:ADP/GDP-polyphosphate phosphotransferase n=1 Tax=Sphaerotilus hippei TaxID=744406 RepID=A0A318H329_9BURK|nr:polyphosphate kinase 2 [Sphaerotilus hippei]PXW97946.1 transcriptional regulator [Sphaerotilus hippei]